MYQLTCSFSTYGTEKTFTKFNNPKSGICGFKSNYRYSLVIDYSEFKFGSKLGYKNKTEVETKDKYVNIKEKNYDIKIGYIKDTFHLIKFLMSNYPIKAKTVRHNPGIKAIEFCFDSYKAMNEFNGKQISCCGSTLKFIKPYDLRDNIYILTIFNIPKRVIVTKLIDKIVKHYFVLGTILACDKLLFTGVLTYADKIEITVLSRKKYSVEYFNSKPLIIAGSHINLEVDCLD